MSKASRQLRRLHRSNNTERNRITLALDLTGDALPTEFRLFVKGWNETLKGKYLFDDVAAASVMAAYRQWGNDLPIDLEHQMLDGAGPDPTKRDARGWCRLEIRNGELWAVGVKWTPDGAARLSEKRQRYISPAFENDSKRRVLRVINIAMTALPATNHTPALVAASYGANSMAAMSSEMVMKALEALQAGDDEAATEILKGMIAAAAGDGEPSANDGSEGDGAEGVSPPAEASEIKPKVVESSETDEDEKDESDPNKKSERKAMRAMLRSLTGVKTMGAVLTAVETYRKSHLTLETERTKLESAERRACVIELVKLGAEFPATVWADDKSTVIKSRWLKMPIEELRAHVVEQREARKGQRQTLKPAASTETATGDVTTLSAAEIKICKETGADPKVYAQLKARRDSAVTAQNEGN